MYGICSKHTVLFLETLFLEKPLPGFANSPCEIRKILLKVLAVVGKGTL
jgi:hypothetical protein